MSFQHAMTPVTTFSVSHSSELMALGRGHNFETVCNYCKRSKVFVLTDICE